MFDARDSSLIYRDLNRTYPTVVRGEGVYVYDADGKRYLDGSGGSSAVTAIGHGVPEVVEAMTAAGGDPRLRSDSRLRHRGG